MKNANLILQEKGIQLENFSYKLCSRVQRLNLEQSVNFKVPMNEWSDLKEKLPFEYIDTPTLKKVIENILVAKQLRHRVTDCSLLELISNNPSYRFYPKSFYFSAE